MKSISVILAVVLFASCQPSKPVIPKIDKNAVYNVIYVANGQKNATQGKIDSIYYDRVFDDSTSLKAHFKIDTGWSLMVVNPKDTARLPNGKPAYDSATHQYRFNSIWYKLQPAERAAVRVQIITI